MTIDHPSTTWYTIVVDGSPIDGSTDDRDEAQANLKLANRESAFDGEAIIIETDEPIAW